MIIDTFLFSEQHEEDLLYLKLLLEDSQVNYWILQENHYTTQGEPKNVFAKQILAQSRFDKFRDRVIICTANTNIAQGNQEGINFSRENWQRALCLPTLSNIASEDTRILISDVDELIDFSSTYRSDKFFQYVQKYPNDAICIGRMRYWYDYDNRCYIPNLQIPTLPYYQIKDDPTLIGRIRNIYYGEQYRGYRFSANEDPIGFEYSYVFKSSNDIWRKKTTFAHNNYTKECIKIALECNHFPSSPLRNNRNPGSGKYDWLEKVILTEQNSPEYVRKNINTLRTNLVDPNYKANRLKRYNIRT